MKRAIRIISIVAVILVTIAALLFGGWVYSGYRMKQERAAWKDPALRRLVTHTPDSQTILSELKRLEVNGEWTDEHVLRMTNGEYIVFEYRHGAHGLMVIDHLFLGHGSNGKWLYSSFHFCQRMNMISREDPPGSISEFQTRYAVQEFDGKSDECLKHTWPERN